MWSVFVQHKATADIIHSYLTSAVVHKRLKAGVIQVMWPPPLSLFVQRVEEFQLYRNDTKNNAIEAKYSFSIQWEE